MKRALGFTVAGCDITGFRYNAFLHLLLNSICFSLLLFYLVHNLFVLAFEHTDHFEVFGLFLLVLSLKQFYLLPKFAYLILYLAQHFIFLTDAIFRLLEKALIFIFLKIGCVQLLLHLHSLVEIFLLLLDKFEDTFQSQLVIP